MNTKKGWLDQLGSVQRLRRVWQKLARLQDQLRRASVSAGYRHQSGQASLVPAHRRDEHPLRERDRFAAQRGRPNAKRTLSHTQRAEPNARHSRVQGHNVASQRGQPDQKAGHQHFGGLHFDGQRANCFWSVFSRLCYRSFVHQVSRV